MLLLIIYVVTYNIGISNIGISLMENIFSQRDSKKTNAIKNTYRPLIIRKMVASIFHQLSM